MKIGSLNQHCGDCGVVEYCGNAYGFCLCYDERFSEMEEQQYIYFAKDAKTEIYNLCKECSADSDCCNCDYDDEARDYYCVQIADYVAERIGK